MALDLGAGRLDPDHGLLGGAGEVTFQDGRKDGSEGCIGCGACCTYMLIPVRPDHHGYYEWLRLHGLAVELYLGVPHVRLEIPCSKLMKGKCSIYRSPKKPEMCSLALCERGAASLGRKVVLLEHDS